MTKQQVSQKEIFKFGWSKTRQHAWFVVLAGLITLIASGAVSSLPVINVIVSVFVGVAITSISLLVVRDHHFDFSSLFTPLLSYKRVLKFAVMHAFYSLPVIIGIVPFMLGVTMQDRPLAIVGALLLIPLFCFIARFSFYPFVAVENENMPIANLIETSFKITKGYFGSIVLFIVLAILLNILGAIFFGVGIFITIPVTLFACAHLYTKIEGHHEAHVA